ncbi:receptor protein [Salix suchowensis]|nr:receptor protein [Salix suchowensis]
MKTSVLSKASSSAELESLDLSQNNLSREIPQQLLQPSFLVIFNVSPNHLTGAIPRGKQFRHISERFIRRKPCCERKVRIRG